MSTILLCVKICNKYIWNHKLSTITSFANIREWHTLDSCHEVEAFYILSNFMAQNPSSTEAVFHFEWNQKSHYHVHKSSHCEWNPTVHYCVHKIFPYSEQMNFILTLLPYCCNIHLHITLPSISRSPKRTLIIKLFVQNLLCISHPCLACHMLHWPHSWFDCPNNFNIIRHFIYVIQAESNIR
jgi:hypothetical protein